MTHNDLNNLFNLLTWIFGLNGIGFYFEYVVLPKLMEITYGNHVESE